MRLTLARRLALAGAVWLSCLATTSGAAAPLPCPLLEQQLNKQQEELDQEQTLLTATRLGIEARSAYLLSQQSWAGPEEYRDLALSLDTDIRAYNAKATKVRASVQRLIRGNTAYNKRCASPV